MYFESLALVLGVISLLGVILALQLLFRGKWFAAWLRVICLLPFIVICVAMGGIALDLRHYHSFFVDQPIFQIRFEQVQPKAHIATIEFVDNEFELEYYLLGDQWQIDSRVLRWAKPVARLGVKPGYQLDRISGRYAAVEQELVRSRTVYSLSEPSMTFDIWGLAHRWREYPSVVQASYGSSTFMPMADGAEYQVSISQSGLVAKPSNEPAQRAMQMWLNE